MPEFNQYPKELTIVVTDRCNLNCFICHRHYYESLIGGKGRFLEIHNLKKLDEAIRHAETIGLTGFGEPFLHPQIDNILEYIYDLNPSDNLISIITNGTLLSAQKARSLNGHLTSFVISLNAACPETYRKETRGEFEKTFTGINQFLRALDAPSRAKVALHFVAHKGNYSEMPRFVRLAKELGIPRVCFNHYMANDLIRLSLTLPAVMDEYNRILDRAVLVGEELGVQASGRKFYAEPETSRQKEEVCASPFRELIVDVDGRAIPCCFNGDLFDLGNIYEAGFEAIWFGEQYKKLRKKRFLRGCETCNKLYPFDDFQVHIHPALKWKCDFNIPIILETIPAEIKWNLQRAEFRRRSGVDWNLYQFPRDIFGPEYSRALNVTGTHPAEENEDRSQACPIPIDVLNECYEKAFRTAKIQAVERYEIDLGGLFYGSNWGFAESNVHGQRWRWLGPGDHSHLFLSLEPGPAYTVRTYIHTASAEAINAFRLQIDDEIPAEQGIASEGGDIFHWCMLPRTSPLAANGAVKITYSLGDIGEPHRARSVLKTSACRKIALSRVVCCPNSVSSHSPA
ncbi:MAG TPA: radical SAM protein [bacterium]|nr:radical SAM protein [bacterium]